MGQSLAIPRVIPNDWKRLDLIVNKIKFNLGRESSPTFTGLTLDTLTLEDLLTNTITIKDSDGNIVVYADVNEFYFVATTIIPIEAGMVMGPWLFWGTYAAP